MLNENLHIVRARNSEMVDLSQISGLDDLIAEYSTLESEYIFTHLTEGSERPQIISGPLRVNGVIFCFVAQGTMSLEINLNTYTIGPNTLVSASSASIININELDSANLDAYVVVLSPEFVKDINIDLNVFESTSLKPSGKPYMELSDSEARLLLRYLELVHLNTRDNKGDIYKRSISRCVIAALMYQLLQIASSRQQEQQESRPMSRRMSYVHDFIELVHQHHKRERSVSFYADKLFITPKYLSLIIKESTGRSAAEWIDDFVILEAKNMLRFSRKNIQQIAYELNFSNQSSFGKYFKNLTGKSPSAYQRSS